MTEVRRTPLWAVITAGLVFLIGCGKPYVPDKIGDPAEVLTDEHAAERPDDGEHVLVGKASWYGKRFQGRTTASGEPFDMYAFTAAHKTLPFHTVVRVTDPASRKSVVVKINDRGPYGPGRVIDLSWAAASDLGMVERGVIEVELEVLQWGDGKYVR